MRIDLHRQVTAADALAGVAAFFGWWRTELFGLLPERWRAAYADWRRRWTLREQEMNWTVSGEGLPQFAFDASLSDDVLCGALAQDAPEIHAHPLDVILPADEVLTRQVTLPAAAASRLRSAVGLQIERLSPFRAEDAGFDCRITGRDHAEGTVSAEVCIVPRKTMRRFEERLRALGLSPDWFRVDGKPFRIRSDAAIARDASGRRLTLAVCGVAVLVWLGVAVFTPVSRDLDLTAIHDQIAFLRPEAERALALRMELGAMRRPARIAASKAAQARPIDVLKVITAVLPDSVRLLELSIEGNRVALTGIAKDAHGLIALVERSRAFHSARFRTPPIPQPDGMQRFNLELTWVLGARPAGTT